MDHSDVRLKRRLFLGGGVSATALALAGCSFDEGGSSADSDTEDGNGSGPSGSATLRLTPATIDSLDPHYVNNAMIVVPAGLLEGLVFSNEDVTDVLPAAAESWEVSEDETLYTFTMREGATWSNGDPVTADDAEWSFRRLLTPTGAGSTYTTGASSYLTGIGIKGAVDHMTGAIDDWDEVGVRALDESTLEVELEAPNADFLIMMSHYSMVLVHPASVEEDAQAWMEPENWVGNGAFVPTRWDPTSSLQMEANETYWDYENVGLRSIEMLLGMDNTAALASFTSGEIDAAVAEATVVEQREDLQEQLVQVPGYAVSYLRYMYGGHEAARDQRVRQALSMAIDREALAAAASTTFEPGTSLIPGNTVPGWDESIAVSYDPDAARDLLDEAGYGDDLPNIRIQSSSEGETTVLLADQWAEVFGVEVNIDVLEAGVHSESLTQPVEDDSLIHVRPGSFGGISTMNNWINNIFGPDFMMQASLSADDFMAYQDIEADDSMDGAEKAEALGAFMREHADPDTVAFSDLAAEAAAELDADTRLAKFLEAAQIREQSAWVYPLTWDAWSFVVSEDIGGFQLRPSPEFIYYKYLTLDA